MITHRIAAEATLAWNAGERRRRASAGLERCVDGVMATGGMLVVNAVGGLNLGLPDGRAGMSLGGALLAAGLAHLSGRRRRVVQARTAVPAYGAYPGPRMQPVRIGHRAA